MKNFYAKGEGLKRAPNEHKNDAPEVEHLKTFCRLQTTCEKYFKFHLAREWGKFTGKIFSLITFTISTFYESRSIRKRVVLLSNSICSHSLNLPSILPSTMLKNYGWKNLWYFENVKVITVEGLKRFWESQIEIGKWGKIFLKKLSKFDVAVGSKKFLIWIKKFWPELNFLTWIKN